MMKYSLTKKYLLAKEMATPPRGIVIISCMLLVVYVTPTIVYNRNLIRFTFNGSLQNIMRLRDENIPTKTEDGDKIYINKKLVGDSSTFSELIKELSDNNKAYYLFYPNVINQTIKTLKSGELLLVSREKNEINNKNKHTIFLQEVSLLCKAINNNTFLLFNISDEYGLCR